MLHSLKKEVLDEIVAAAREGQASRVVSATERLRHVESLLERQRALVSEAESLVSATGSRHEPDRAAPSRQTRGLGESPRVMGDRRRSEFVKSLSRSGIRLVQRRGALYENGSGQLVGIAYASERVKDGWFLGLPEGSFTNAVLLCEAASGTLFAVCLPQAFFQQYGKSLSTSQRQIKFNVKKRAGRYYVPVPRLGAVDVTQYIDNYGLVA